MNGASETALDGVSFFEEDGTSFEEGRSLDAEYPWAGDVGTDAAAAAAAATAAAFLLR